MQSKTSGINDFWKAELSEGEELVLGFGYAQQEIILATIVFSLLAALSLFILIGFILLPVAILFTPYYFSRTPKYALTNKRIICIEGLLNKTKKYVDYTKITDITMKQGMISKLIGTGALFINTAGGPEKEITIACIEDPGRIKDQIYKAAKIAHKSYVEQNKAEVHYTQELEKLAELLDRNIITAEEFEAKKRQILGL